MGIGSFIYALPQFLGSKYSPIANDDDWELCGVDNPSPQSDSGTDHDHNLWYFFIIANLLIGAGSCALYTVGPEYLDDNVPQKSRLSMFMGIFYAASALGRKYFSFFCSSLYGLELNRFFGIDIQ